MDATIHENNISKEVRILGKGGVTDEDYRHKCQSQGLQEPDSEIGQGGLRWG
jgi:hypothetical protein